MGHLARYQEIAETFARHGLGFLADAVGVALRRKSSSGIPATPGDQTRSAPERLRVALEDLGPTFVKLGQLLSTRADLLPQPYIAELSKLQDAAPPVPAAVIVQAIIDELGAAPDELFAEFDPRPLASASIGQAHAATLRDGTPVVVKVRRPDAVRQVNEDLEILHNLAERAARTWDPARAYNVRGLVQEFADTLREELDYLHEARNAERFAANFAARPEVSIPRVYWETTTSRVLTLERMTGINVGDLPRLEAAGIDRGALAVTGAEVVLQMIFEDRFFHADPHPGNLFVRGDGGIALIDFGMAGELSHDLEEDLAAFVIAFTFADSSALTDALLELSVTRGSVDEDELREAMRGFVRRYRGRSLSQVSFTQLTTQLLAILHAQHLQLPSEVALVFKVLFTVEGVGRQLDPDFDMTGVLTPFARRLIGRRYSLTALARQFARSAADSGSLMLDLPGRLGRLLRALDRNGLEVHLRAAELEPLVDRSERIGNRLVAGMIAAALIRGLGGLVTSDRRWRSWESVLMSAGVTAVTSLIGYLLWTSRRHRPPTGS